LLVYLYHHLHQKYVFFVDHYFDFYPMVLAALDEY
jgi:hypothetical protein